MAKLLLVDDDQGSLAWMTAALEGAGHEVRGVTSGQDGLAALAAWRPDLIVADILMTEMNGLAFARLVRCYHPVPVLFISIARKQAEAILCGAVGYVQKPVTASEVRTAVEQVLGRAASQNTILVVDDDLDIRALYREFLEPRFFVLEAADGGEALSVLARQSVDLLITDVHMPVMNGVELIRAVRDDPRLRDLPIIVQTGDLSLLRAPLWVDLRVSQTISKGEFMRWLLSQIEERVEAAPTP